MYKIMPSIFTLKILNHTQNSRSWVDRQRGGRLKQTIFLTATSEVTGLLIAPSKRR